MPKGKSAVLVKTAPEISLKSFFVESFFLKKLKENMLVALKQKKLKPQQILRQRGRFFLFTKKPKQTIAVLRKVFGIHALAEAGYFQGGSLEEIRKQSAIFAKTFLKKGDSFAVRCSRHGRQSFSSQDAAAASGEEILATVKGLKVNLSQPDKEVFVEIYGDYFLLYSGELACQGGLPVGTEGNLAFFFGGRKEEALAAWLLLKRGCRVFPVVLDKKAKKIVQLLEPWNCYRKFKYFSEKELPELLESQKILALATADLGLEEKDFAVYLFFDKMHGLPVLRPLLLYPKELFKKNLGLILHGD